MNKIWKKYKYKNITFAIISLGFTIFLIQFQPFHEFLLATKELEYLGVFIAGALFVSIFTVSIGAVLLLIFAENLPLLNIAIIGGLGSVFADLLIFSFVRSKSISKEINRVLKNIGGDKLKHLIHTKYFAWSMPLVGALIIASPLPDELGVSLLGMSKISKVRFVLICFVLDSLGILLVLVSSRFIKP